jgi:hypothetical protein
MKQHKKYNAIQKYNMKECILYKKLKNNKARCNLCYRYCNLGENQIGFCGVRKNIKGKYICLFTESLL